MRTSQRRGIAYGLTAGALAVMLACAGCAGTAQDGAASASNGQSSSAASNVEASNVAVQNEGASSNQNESTSSEANSNESSQDQSTSTNENASSNANATTVAVDGEDAQGVLPDGWYLTSLTGTEDPSSISVASVRGDTWTLTGTLTRADSEDSLYGDANQGEVGPGTWRLKVADDATFEAGSGPQAADRSTFETTLTSLNGLGLVLHVQNGQVTYARLAS